MDTMSRVINGAGARTFLPSPTSPLCELRARAHPQRPCPADGHEIVTKRIYVLAQPNQTAGEHQCDLLGPSHQPAHMRDGVWPAGVSSPRHSVIQPVSQQIPIPT